MLDYLKSLRNIHRKLDIRLLADQAILAHLLMTILACLWAMLVGQMALAAIVIGLCGIAFVIWVEFKNEDL